MSKKRLFSAVATLVGCVIGAGILGIPYVVAKAGFITGLINIVGLGLLLILLHLYLGEVTLRTKGNHQLTAYAEKYTGKIGKYFMFISMVLGIYGAIVAYTLGGGDALASMFGGDPLFWSVVFFGVMSWLVYMGLHAIEKSEAFVMPFVIIIVILIFILAIPKININNLTSFSFSKILVPYGVVLFALLGNAAIPEVKEELDKHKKELKKDLIMGSTIPMIIYILFALAIVGVLGTNTNEIGALGLAEILGQNLAFLGPLFALFAMATSFLALGLALQELFLYDYNLRKNTSWLLSCFIPFLVFLLIKLGKIGSFITVLNLTGVITGAIMCVIIVLMILNAKKKFDRKPEYSIYINKYIAVVLIILFVIGALNLVL